MFRILFVCLILNCFEKQTVEVYRKESFFQEINVSKVQGTSNKNILTTNQKHIQKCLLNIPSETNILFLFAGKLKNLLYLGMAQPSPWPSLRFLVQQMAYIVFTARPMPYVFNTYILNIKIYKIYLLIIPLFIYDFNIISVCIFFFFLKNMSKKKKKREDDN